MKKTISVFLVVLMLLSFCIPVFAANDTKITALDNSTIDGSMWMIAGGEDELYIYPSPREANAQFDIYQAVITSSNEKVLGVAPGKRDTYEYGYVVLTGKSTGTATVTVTDPGSGASCSVKVTVLPQFLQSVMSFLVSMQTILARLRITISNVFSGNL